jgi:hypothetical protein
MSTLFIKNMVCNRCILVVQNELDKLGLEATNIKLGEIILKKDLTTAEREALENVLDPLGFQVIDDKKSRMIEKIKNVIIDLVHHQDNASYNDRYINRNHRLQADRDRTAKGCHQQRNADKQL